jgi:hypothetical protein
MAQSAAALEEMERRVEEAAQAAQQAADKAAQSADVAAQSESCVKGIENACTLLLNVLQRTEKQNGIQPQATEQVRAHLADGTLNREAWLRHALQVVGKRVERKRSASAAAAAASSAASASAPASASAADTSAEKRRRSARTPKKNPIFSL